MSMANFVISSNGIPYISHTIGSPIAYAIKWYDFCTPKLNQLNDTLKNYKNYTCLVPSSILGG